MRNVQTMDSSVEMIRREDGGEVGGLGEGEGKPVGFLGLFRFADRSDYVIMAVGVLAAITNGAALPLFALLWGNMIDTFKSKADMVDQAKNMLLIFIYIGLGALVTGWIMISTWLITGQKQSIHCRKTYLKSLLSQQISWFDCINQSELSSNFSTDTLAFQEGISEKVPLVIYVLAMGVSGLIVSFVRGWLLTIVLLGIFPVLVGAMYMYVNNVHTRNRREERSYGKAGGRAEQTLSAIKTVKTLNGQAHESKFYEQCLEQAGKGTIKFGAFAGLSIGALFFAMLTQYSLGFWFGAHCIEATQRCPASIARQEYTAGRVFTVYFSLFLVGFNLSQLPASLKKIAEGKAAAGRIYKIIDRIPKIRNPQNAIKLQNFKGIIEFENVTFSYPKSPNKKILSNLSFKTSKNKIAFVGQSGCGKSTIMQLLMRFYDPDSGVIRIDGHDLRTIDLDWLRGVVGYVGQEPVLFDTTIRENLLFVREGASQDELENALRKAQALEFVNKLEKRMDTNVGMGGSQISGGQKQRLAIARAILKDPKILLLDEATSALDRKNQKLIQRTLNQISEARLSITIAHRVKTVMSSDQIFVIEKGKVKQHGNFKQLKRFQGLQIQTQQQQSIKNQTDQKDDQPQAQPQPHQNHPTPTKQQQLLKQKQQLLQIYNKSTYSRVFAYARGNEILFVIGIAASVVIGAIYPVFSIFLASLLEIMLTRRDFMEEANTRALIFLLLGVLWLVLSTVQNMVFQYIGEKITRKIRSETFYKLLKLPIYWHENPKNSVGSLNSRLGVDCKRVKDMTTTTIYGLIQNISTLVTGLVIAFIFQWRTSLVALGLIPFLIAAGAIRMSFRDGSITRAEQAYRSSSNLITESMTNIRTVCSFGYENIIFIKYSNMMQEPYRLAVKNGIVSGFFYGVSQFTVFLVIALIFYIGALFVQGNDVTVRNMFTAVFAIFYSAMTVGNNSHILPDLGQCKISAANLFIILDTKDQDQIQIDQNSKLLKSQIRGDITLQNISFKYETRSQYLFNKFNLTIPYGEKVAFVGSSGCGKSTILAFLLRFYQPESGTILLDGVDIKDYDVHFLRQQFGVVSQEPVLFNTSFKENIKYNMDKATDQEIVQAAKQAHAYDFIMGGNEERMKHEIIEQNDKQPKQATKTGFDRSVGIKGSHISGGQKQRIAIARAILRKPQILLLDEATSALDSTNQQKVQNCLDEIMQNKSSISIAHRIDTIKNAKVIFVFEKGRVVESGTYEELIGKEGYFYNLERGREFK